MFVLLRLAGSVCKLYCFVGWMLKWSFCKLYCCNITTLVIESPDLIVGNKLMVFVNWWHSTIITKHFGMFITVQYWHFQYQLTTKPLCHYLAYCQNLINAIYDQNISDSSISANNTVTLWLLGTLPKPDICNIWLKY